LEKLKQSANYKKNAFQNLSDTPMKPDDISYWKLMKEFIRKNKNTAPPGYCLGKNRSQQFGFVKTIDRMVWTFSYLIRIENKNFLIDPFLAAMQHHCLL
jgi:hypothetical protein